MKRYENVEDAVKFSPSCDMVLRQNVWGTGAPYAAVRDIGHEGYLILNDDEVTTSRISRHMADNTDHFEIVWVK